MSAEQEGHTLPSCSSKGPAEAAVHQGMYARSPVYFHCQCQAARYSLRCGGCPVATMSA